MEPDGLWQCKKRWGVDGESGKAPCDAPPPSPNPRDSWPDDRIPFPPPPFSESQADDTHMKCFLTSEEDRKHLTCLGGKPTRQAAGTSAWSGDGEL